MNELLNTTEYFLEEGIIGEIGTPIPIKLTIEEAFYLGEEMNSILRGIEYKQGKWQNPNQMSAFNKIYKCCSGKEHKNYVENYEAIKEEYLKDFAESISGVLAYYGRTRKVKDTTLEVDIEGVALKEIIVLNEEEKFYLRVETDILLRRFNLQEYPVRQVTNVLWARAINKVYKAFSGRDYILYKDIN